MPTPNARACFSSVSIGVFGGRVRDRRKVAEDLVHVEQRAQAASSPADARIHATISFRSSVTKNMRSASDRCAIERIETRGFAGRESSR